MRATCLDTADLLTPSRRAAAEKPPHSTTSAKISIASRRAITTVSSWKQYCSKLPYLYQIENDVPNLHRERSTPQTAPQTTTKGFFASCPRFSSCTTAQIGSASCRERVCQYV